MNIKKYFIFIIMLWGGTRLQAQNTADSIATQVNLNEVIVSSTKETFRTKDLPASVSLLSSRQLERENASSLRSVTTLAPNFYMPDYGSKLTSPVYIRGIGSRINSPSVGLYVDGVPYFEKSSFDFDFFDIEYVEVLRGPQGTLYGRNTMGGMINVATKSPLRHRGTNVSLSGGNYGYMKATLSNYSKLTDRLGMVLGVNYLAKGGYYTNHYSGDKVASVDDISGRLRLAYRHSDKAVSELSVNYEHSKQDGYAYAKYDPETGAVDSVDYDHPSSYTRDILSAGYKFEYQTSWGSIRANTGYQYLNDEQAIDQDYTAKDLYSAVQRTKQNMISQEVIAKSDLDGNYRWVTGLFGFYQQIDNPVNVNYNMPVPPSYYARTPDTASIINDTHTYGLAAYHQSTLNNILIKGLSATVGLRVDYEKSGQDYRQQQWMMDGILIEAEPETTLEFFEFLPKAALRYMIGKQAVYASVSKGYKTGGFNPLVEEEQYRSFDPEQSWNYELGVKLQLGGSTSVDVAGFYIDLTNQHIPRTVPSGAGQMIVNAGKSASKGVELSVNTQPLNNLNLNLSYGYTHATLTDYTPSETVDYSGNFIPQIPRQTLGAGATYRWPVSLTWLDDVTFHALYTGVGEIYWNDSNTAKQNGYGLLNASIGFSKSFADVTLWARNILDTKYNVYYFDIPQLQASYVQPGIPFLIGLDVKLKF